MDVPNALLSERMRAGSIPDRIKQMRLNSIDFDLVRDLDKMSQFRSKLPKESVETDDPVLTPDPKPPEQTESCKRAPCFFGGAHTCGNTS